jgi:hypothetical protein
MCGCLAVILQSVFCTHSRPCQVTDVLCRLCRMAFGQQCSVSCSIVTQVARCWVRRSWRGLWLRRGFGVPAASPLRCTKSVNRQVFDRQVQACHSTQYCCPPIQPVHEGGCPPACAATYRSWTSLCPCRPICRSCKQRMQRLYRAAWCMLWKRLPPAPQRVQ